jgi:hypothetical protein
MLDGLSDLNAGVELPGYDIAGIDNRNHIEDNIQDMPLQNSPVLEAAPWLLRAAIP